MQDLKRGEFGVAEALFRHREDVKVAASQPPVTQDRRPGDIDAVRDPGECRVECCQVLVERRPRLWRQDFRSG